jgi:GTP cyclohydrolase I
MIDQEKIAYHIRGILEALGDDPEREGLRETPQRVAKMYSEVFAGMNYTNSEIAALFDKTFPGEDGGSQDLVLVRDIDVFSYCEHHLALMYDMKVSVAYLPQGKVIGLSKIARIADLAARRLQLQERLGRDIAEIISMVTGSPDVAVVISGSHSCMTARGIEKPGAKTITETYRGRFQEDPVLQMRMEALLR